MKTADVSSALFYDSAERDPAAESRTLNNSVKTTLMAIVVNSCSAARGTRI